METDFKPKRRADRDVVAYAEFTGLRNDVATERFDATDLAVADNVTLDRSRRLARRAGATRCSGLPAHSLWSEGESAMFVSGTDLRRIDYTLAVTPVSSGLSGAPVSFARGGDTVYFSDGTTPRAIGAAGVRSWGLEVPPALFVVPTAGNLVPGRYGLAYTYLRSDGQESGASETVFADVPAGGGLQLTTIDALDPDVVAKRVFMTTPDGEVLLHVAYLSKGTNTYVPKAVEIFEANEPLTTQFMGPPPAGQLVAYYRGRMFVAQGRFLYPSEPFAYELFDQRNYIELDDDITMLAPLEDRSGDASGFFVGTRKSSGIIAGSDPATFSYVAKSSFGVVQGALAYIDGALFDKGQYGARELPMWLSTEGLCLGTPGLDVTNLTRDRYTFATGGAGAALFDPTNQSFVAVSEGHSAIVMNTSTLTLTTFSNYGYNSFARVGPRLVGASGAGLFELVGDTDAGAPIHAQVSFGTTDFGSTFLKGLDRLYIGYRSSTGLVVKVVTEGTNWNLYEMPATSTNELATQRVKTGRGLAARYWQFSLANVDGADFAIDTVDVKSVQLGRRINGRA